jgi:hypothetical protein
MILLEVLSCPFRYKLIDRALSTYHTNIEDSSHCTTNCLFTVLGFGKHTETNSEHFGIITKNCRTLVI